jgi:phage gp29-like protein
MLYSAFYGWGVAEVIWKPNGERVSFDRIVVRDRARFRFDINGNLYLWTMASGWQTMPERKFWTISTGADNHDEPYGLGLAHSLYWPVFFKRNDVQFWLMFLEKFGQPTAMAKIPAGQIDDPTTRQNAIAMLQNIATDAGIVVPDNVVIELLEASRSGSADYAGMFEAMNASISKIVLGQTMTTDNGASRSQSEVHERVAQRIVEADSDLLCGSFNMGPVRWWTEWNFPGATPPMVYRNTEQPENLAERAERDTKIAMLGYEPTEDYINKTYGEGWQRKADPIAAMAGALAAPAGQGDPGQDFAEGENVALAALRVARRKDQQAIFNAAKMFSEQHETVTGKRVKQLLQAAEYSDDPETFNRRLDEILAEQPPKNTMQALTRSLFFSGLLGALRSNRKQA